MSINPKTNKTVHNKDNANVTQISSNLNAGNNIVVNSGTTNIIGSNLEANNIAIKADTGSINILNAQDTQNDSSLDKKVDVKLNNVIKGSLNSVGGLSADNTKLKVNVASASYDEEKVNSNSSVGDINISNSIDTQNQTKDEKHAKAELNLTVQNEYVETAQAVRAVVEATQQLKQTKDDYSNYKSEVKKLEVKLTQLQTSYKNKEAGVDYTDIEDLVDIIDNVKSQEKYYLAAISAASVNVASKSAAVISQADAAARSSGTAGFSAGVSLDVNGSKKNTNSNSTTSNASNLNANNIYMQTNKDLPNTSIDITGSNVIANENIGISTSNLNVIASQDTTSQTQDNKSINGSVAFTMYGGGGGTAGLGYGTNNSQSNTVVNHNSTLQANNMNIDVENDANFVGANVRANDTLNLNVGNNLNLESVRDEYSSNNKGFNVNAGIGFGSAGAPAKRSPSFDVGKQSSTNAGFSVNNGTSLNKQTVLSSITANNLNVDVQGNTNLKGSLIASGNFDENNNFIDNKNLNFTTNTLSFENMSNTSYSSNQSIGLSANYNLEGTKVVDGKSIPQEAGISSASYNASNGIDVNASKTLATLGTGNINIKDTANSDDLSRLNTDTTKINKDLYSASTETKVDAVLDTRLLSETGREQIAKEFDTVQKDWYGIYKVAGAYLSDESKEKLKDLLKGDMKSISAKDKEAIKDMKASALKQGYDVDKMTKDEKINLLEKLSGMNLTTEQKQLRDAVWVSNIPLSEDWNNMRNTQINSIVDNSVKSKSFWITEQSWESMTTEDKQKFLQNYNDQNRSLIGNPLSAKVIIDSIDGKGQTMANYSTFLWTRSITLDSTDIGNFYNTVNLINHEGSGHGYQDYAISNKSNYINIHPAQIDDVKILDLSYDGTIGPNKNVVKNPGVYLSDPAEQDAWRMGDTVEKNLTNSKKGN